MTSHLVKNNIQHPYIVDAMRKSLSLAKYLKTPYTNKAIEVFPGIYSDDPRLLNVSREMAARHYDEKPTSTSGFLNSPYLLGNFNQLHQIAGYKSDPMGSAGIREPGKHDKSFLKLLGAVARILCAESEPSGLRINKISTIGFPERTSDLIIKLRALKYGIENFDAIIRDCDLTLSGKMSIAAWGERHSFLPLYTEGRRYQHTDAVNREDGRWSPRLRKLFDWTGKDTVANRTIEGISDFFTVRPRFYYAFTGHINYLLNFFAYGVRNYMYEKYENMFYTGPHNIAEKVKDLHLVSADVANFDQNFDQEIMDVIIDNMLCFDDAVKTLIRFSCRAPIILKNDHVNKPGWTLSRDIGLPGVDNAKANPSGWAFVDIANKIYGVTIQIAAAYGLSIADSTDRLNRALLGLEPVKLLNCGDDMVFMFTHLSDYQAFIKRGRSQKIDNVTLEIEDSVKYLGMSLMKTSRGIEYLLDIRNVPVKISVPERDMTSRHHPYYAFGLRTKLNYYSKHPRFEDVYRSWNSLLKKHFGKDLLNLVELDKTPTNVLATNVADQVFIEDPTSVYWKLRERDVNPLLLQEYYAFVPLKEFTSLLKHFK